MGIHMYLVFNGNCKEAIEFYAEAFGADKPQIMTFGEIPQSSEYVLPEEAKDLVMHARMNILGGDVLFSDNFPGAPFTVGNNLALAVVTGDEGRIRKSFDALKEGGTVRMELQETFWSKCYGSLTDKFGVEWQFNYEATQS
ncbi:VOC family protein [Lysinibacillus sp. 54212]|uniref:VOC family protein n=1 Tax=Lysinibacillus sp. 54212 TaxID=3119829 RepID=UPI002FC9D8B1